MNTQKMNKGTAIVGCLLSFLAGSGLSWAISRQPLEPGGTRPTALAEASPDQGSGASPIPIGADDPSWGNPAAPVTLVALSDFECPYCARVLPTLASLKQQYGPDKLRIVWKNYPLPSHPGARPAAEVGAAVHALGGKFWELHDQAFANQRALTKDNLASWATSAGVQRSALEAELASGRPARKVDTDQALAQRLGVTGTPAFRINGKALSGAQPLARFQALIDEQLAAAGALAQDGIPPARRSLELTRRNVAAAPRPDAQPARPAAARPPPEDTSIWRVPVAASDPVQGPADALVTLVEFSDFQCPYCSRVLGTLERLQQKYGRDLRLVWKDAPLSMHPRARPAATLARAALAEGGNAGFWKAHAALFQNQRQLDDAGLEQIARQLGLDWSKASAAIASDRYAASIDQSNALMAELGANGTPAFFINGRKLSGAQPDATFERLIDEQLAIARGLVERGIQRNRVYHELMRTARTAVR